MQRQMKEEKRTWTKEKDDEVGEKGEERQERRGERDRNEFQKEKITHVYYFNCSRSFGIYSSCLILEFNSNPKEPIYVSNYKHHITKWSYIHNPGPLTIIGPCNIQECFICHIKTIPLPIGLIIKIQNQHNAYFLKACHPPPEPKQFFLYIKESRINLISKFIQYNSTKWRLKNKLNRIYSN